MLNEILDDIVNKPTRNKLDSKLKRTKSVASKNPESSNIIRSYKLVSLNQKSQSDERDFKALEITFTGTKVRRKQVTVRSYDCVTIASNSKDSKPYVGQVIKFSKTTEDELIASIRWFYLSHEIPSRKLPKQIHDKEIFFNSSNSYSTDRINAKTILDVCRVKWINPGDAVGELAENEFVYRRSFDGKALCDMSQPYDIKDYVPSSPGSKNSTSARPSRKTPSKYKVVKQDNCKPPNNVTPSVKTRTSRGQKFMKQSPPKKDMTPMSQAKEISVISPISANSKTPKMNRGHKDIKQSPPEKGEALQSQVERITVTSPISASTYGRFNASDVAACILYDDLLEVESNSSISSESSSVISAKVMKMNHRKTINKVEDIPEVEVSLARIDTEKRTTHAGVGTPKKTTTKKISSTQKTKKSASVNHDSPIKNQKKNDVYNHYEILSSRRTSKRLSSINSLNNKQTVTPITIKVSKKMKGRNKKEEISDPLGEESLSESDSEYSGESSSSESSADDFVVTETPYKRTPKRKPQAKSVKKTHQSTKKSTVTPVVIRLPQNRTPFIPARPTPVKQMKSNLEKARKHLHVSAVPDCLPCRESEFQEIYTFVEGKIRSGSGGCMYVSGVPGTGKTATVRVVMNSLRESADDGDIPDFLYIDINGMRLTEPRQAYVQLLEQLTKEKATADHAADLLSKYFSQRRKKATVLLADELDLLWTRKQDVLYHLFDWPTHRHARLIVVAIANTMDLPERILMNRVASRLGLTRLTFRPYSFSQLQEIVTSRVESLKTFEADAVQLVSRKVAAVSGDARRCLDICRRATEIAGRNSKNIVEIEDVHSALQEMFASPMIKAIRCCSKQEQLFLQSVVGEFRHSGVEEATLGRIVEQHSALSQLNGVTPVTVSTLFHICHNLASNRLILLEGGHRDIYSRIRLNASVDDVLFALKLT